MGSTSISAGLDAEDWRDLVGAYLDAASAAVTEMGGHVAKKLGRIMALFGYPVAREKPREMVVLQLPTSSAEVAIQPMLLAATPYVFQGGAAKKRLPT